MTDLKPCPNPWCARTIPPITISEPDAKGAHTLLAKRCFCCGVQSPAKPTLDEAEAAWNTRADGADYYVGYYAALCAERCGQLIVGEAEIERLRATVLQLGRNAADSQKAYAEDKAQPL